MEEVINNIKCEKCGSSQTYYRCKTLDFHCFKCGYDFKKKGDDKE